MTQRIISHEAVEIERLGVRQLGIRNRTWRIAPIRRHPTTDDTGVRTGAKIVESSLAGFTAFLAIEFVMIGRDLRRDLLAERRECPLPNGISVSCTEKPGRPDLVVVEVSGRINWRATRST